MNSITTIRNSPTVVRDTIPGIWRSLSQRAGPVADGGGAGASGAGPSTGGVSPGAGTAVLDAGIACPGGTAGAVAGNDVPFAGTVDLILLLMELV